MATTQRTATLLFMLGLVAAMIACKKDEDEPEENGCGQSNISAHGSTESHNNGQNCMSCHRDGGGGKGCFTVAGSVYQQNGTTPAPNGTVKLYTGENGSGTLRATIEVDVNGNFHTTGAVDFTGGLYPKITPAGGGAGAHMDDPVTTGACNSCHGNTEERIKLP
jgi:hypothetical protein